MEITKSEHLEASGVRAVVWLLLFSDETKAYPFI